VTKFFIPLLIILITATFCEIVDGEGDPYFHRDYYDPVKAGPSLVSISMILGGFSFAGVILVLNSQMSETSLIKNIL
jgi:hypothetical protein